MSGEHEVGSRAERYMLSPSEPLPMLEPGAVETSLLQLGVPVVSRIKSDNNTIWTVTASQEQITALKNKFGVRLTIEPEGQVSPQ
jgi:hypothetical protein